MELKDIQASVAELVTREGWQDAPLEHRLNYLFSEVQETEEAVMEVERVHNPVTHEFLAHELYDIIWNVAELANRYGIDLDKAAQDKTLLNQNRVFSLAAPKVALISKDVKTEAL